MKRLISTLCLSGLAAAAFAQGTVNFSNGSNTSIHTNALAVSGGTTGNTSSSTAAPGGYLFEVLTANSTVTSVDSSLQGLLSSTWSDTGLIGSNTTFATGGRIGASGTGLTVNNWQPGVQQSFIVVGWSASEGSTWAQVAAKLNGATFVNNGSGNTFQGGTLTLGGFIGASTIQAGQAGGGAQSLAAFSLFGTAAGSSGTPITTPTDLFIVTAAPEPGTFALVGLGAAAMLIFRRRK